MKRKEFIRLVSLIMAAAIGVEMPATVMAEGISDNHVAARQESVSYNEVQLKETEAVLIIAEEEVNNTDNQNVEEFELAKAASNEIVVRDGSGAIKNTIKIEGTDIGSELNTAIERATSLASASNIYDITVPSGNYDLEKTLIIRSNIKLNLTGVTFKKRLNAGIGTMVRFGEFEQKFSGYTGTENVTIIGGTFDGQGAKDTTEGAALVRVAHGKNVTFDGVSVLNVKDNHHFETAAVDGLTVKNCTFKGFTAITEGGARKEAVQLDIMEETHFPDYPNYDRENAPLKNVLVTGCTFDTVGRGVGAHSCVAGSYLDNVVIENNTFINVNKEAIIAVHFKNTKIRNNVIKNCGNGIIFQTIKPNGEQIAKPLAGTDNILTDVDYNTEITNNQINLNPNTIDDSASGVEIHGCSLNLFDKNLDFVAKNIKVENNIITSPCYGIRVLHATACTLKNNKITYSGANKQKFSSILLIRGSIGNEVLNNTITNADRCGILLNEKSNQNTVRENKVTDTNLHGIIVTSESKNNLIESNYVEKVKENGIVVSYSSQADIKNNQVQSAGKHAIHVAASTAEVTNCSLTGSGKNGMNAAPKSKVTVKNNTISNNRHCGVFVAKNCSGMVTDNTYSKNKTSNVTVLGNKTLKVIDSKKFKIKKAKAKKKQAVIKWSADNFAKKYEIYRAESKNGTYKKVKTVKAKEKKYTDKKLTSKKNYYYKVLVQQKNGKVTVKEITSNVLKIKVK